VKRGHMIREVRGVGTLVAEEVLWIPAVADGRVVRINVYPGAVVDATTVLMELDNPELRQQTLDAEFNLKAAEAAYQELSGQLENQLFEKNAAAAQLAADYKQAALYAARDKQLDSARLIPRLDAEVSAMKADQLKARADLEGRRLMTIEASNRAQLSAQDVKIDQARALYELRKGQLDQLKVHAGAAGVVAQLGAAPAGSNSASAVLEVGQQISAGTILAKIAQLRKLDAELKIGETDAKDLVTGQPARIDTRNGVIQGKVSRIAPVAVNGNVKVDVELLGELPKGARPDLSVEGAVELERLNDVTYMSRPASGQPGSAVSVFRIEPDGHYASRVQVRLGRASVNVIEVLNGLQPGDRVILSDMTTEDGHDRIRLN
jgi:HlyD family secretion protein